MSKRRKVDQYGNGVWAGQCMWCPESWVNHEDIIAVWIAELIRDELLPPGGQIEEVITRTDYTGAMPPRVPKRRNIETVAGPKRLIVCPSCNWGWMRELEMTNRTILRTMILGKAPVNGRHLTTTDLTNLATWMTKTAFGFDYGVGMHQVVPSAIAHAFYEMGDNRTPPQSVHVWLGACAWDVWNDPPANKTHYPVTNEEQSGMGVWITFQLGFLIIQLYFSEDSEPPDRQGSRILFEIWPTQERHIWPPSAYVPYSGINYLACPGTHPELGGMAAG